MKNNCRYSLDKGWKFTEQPCTVLPEILTHEKVYGFAKTGGAGGPAFDSYDDSEWEKVDLPHDWMHYQNYDKTAAPDHGYRRGGTAWYRRRFLLSKDDKKKAVSICFDGIGGRARVYLNGIQMEVNESRYNSFCVNITDAANYGGVPNILAVEVDSREWEGWWYEGAGLYRHVWLLKEPGIHAAYNGIYIKPEWDERTGAWHTHTVIRLMNALADKGISRISLDILDDLGEQVSERVDETIELGGFCECEKNISLDVKSVKLWSPDHPVLYSLRLRIEAEEGRQEIKIPFGYRTIRVDPDTGFWLNGENIKLLGTCNHQDHACTGTAVPDTVAEYRLRKLKEMGCNAYRCAHHNPSPELLDICDRIGLMVMDENRMFNSSEQGMKYLRAMVQRDRNHPCVIIYSLFNEEPLQGTAKGRRIAEHMTAELKKWDETRPVLGAFNGGFMERQGAADVFDITGINYFTDSYDEFHRAFPRQPIVASELVSAFSTRGVIHTDTEEQEFDNYDHNQAAWGQSVREANREVLSREFIMGMFVWTGFDYRGEPSPYEWPSVSSHFGIMDMCGFPKDTYYLYQAYWKNENVLHLFPHWNHNPGDIVTVMTYSNCKEIELFVNGVSCGKKKNQIFEQCRWEVKYLPGKIEAIGYCRDGSVIRDERRTAGTPAALKLESVNQEAYKDTKDAVILNITAIDEDGLEVPQASNLVKITVEGGELIGMGNGSPNCHASERGPEYPLFNGKCQAILRAGLADKLWVYAEAEGMKRGQYSWPVLERSTEKEAAEADVMIVGDWKVSHQIWDEKPDPVMEIGKSDMNTMEPIEFDDTPLQRLKDKKGKYALYRTELALPGDFGRYQLRFVKCAGEVEVFWRGKHIGLQNNPVAGEVLVEFSEEKNTNGTLTVILRNTANDVCAGILGAVEINNG